MSLSVVQIHMYSCADFVRGFSHHSPGLVRAWYMLSKSAHILAVILSVASHAIAWISHSPWSTVQFCTDSHCNFVRNFWNYLLDIATSCHWKSQATRNRSVILSTASHDITLIFPVLRVEYLSIYMNLPYGHCNNDFGTIYMLNWLQLDIYPSCSNNNQSN